MHEVRTTKYNVVYEDNNGSFHSALLNHYPTENDRKQLHMADILRIEKVEVVTRKTTQQNDIPTYNLKPTTK